MCCRYIGNGTGHPFRRSCDTNPSRLFTVMRSAVVIVLQRAISSIVRPQPRQRLSRSSTHTLMHGDSAVVTASDMENSVRHCLSWPQRSPESAGARQDHPYCIPQKRGNDGIAEEMTE